MQDSIAVLAPNLEEVGSLVVVSELLTKNLHLEDAIVGGSSCLHIIVAVVLNAVQPKIEKVDMELLAILENTGLVLIVRNQVDLLWLNFVCC